MMKKILLLGALLLAGCSSSDEATKVLSATGYTDIRITGYRIFGCSKDDTFHTGFEANAPSGTRVTGVVCSAFLKGATVRLD